MYITLISLHFGNFLAISEIWHNSAGASSVPFFVYYVCSPHYWLNVHPDNKGHKNFFDIRVRVSMVARRKIILWDWSERECTAGRTGSKTGSSRAQLGQGRAAVAGCQLATLIKTLRRRRRDTDRIINKDFEPRLLRRSFAVLTCSELFNETKTETDRETETLAMQIFT